MKRLFWIVALLALVLAGCGGAADDEGDSGESGDASLANAPGFDGKTIKLGILTPLTGPVAVIGKPLTAGNEVYFDYVNSQGGIAGKYKVELVQEDTQYSPPATVQQYNKIKNNVVAFTQVLGTAPTLATLPQLAQDKIIAAPASLDAFWVREPNLLPVGGPYQVQAINALDYYVNQADGKGKNICSFIQDDAYGEAGQSGVDFAAEELGFKVVDTQKFKVGDKDVTGQVQRLQGSKCDAVFLVATPDRRGHDLGHGRQARLRAALDRPVADVDRRAGRLAAGRVPPADDVDRGRGHGVGRHQRARHEGHDGPGRRSSSPTSSRTTTSRSATCRASP